ncbi:SDR family NAD(P)-dependent oxidoreductase [Aminobacter sp. LjRoot7]|uniref:SDR family NAD(P)-dependent oxidoreductase n=1 Tax=Aminobacter sp. LjRoot7 TaxID=3342335 RepID=UPI003ECEFBC9
MAEHGLVGKKVLVTGASSGLGLHFGTVLAAAGGEVILAARSLDKVEAAAAAMVEDGGKAHAVRMDVANRKSVEDVFGRFEIDVVVNNAGITVSASAKDLSDDDFDAVIDTNLKGVFTVSQVAARQMIARGGGAIVNIASILGLRVAGHVAAYAASKAGVIQLTKALALEWARYGIRVNALCPGYIETPLNRDFFASEPGQALMRRIPMRRLGRPSDLDAPLLLLCSDAASYMSGSIIAIDGGHLVSSL